jgi:hemerythrin-like domain-containing protein
MTTHTHTHTSAEARPDVHEMVVIHRVFRREFSAIPTLVRRVAEGDRARAETVGSHLGLILAGLHMHHTGEDEVLWPLLLERAAPSTGLVETMQSQHQRVDEYADQLGPLLDAWKAHPSPLGGEQLARIVEQFAQALLEHLDLEEREILPLVSRHISVAEWDSLGEHGKDSMSARQLPLMFGSILEEADEDERSRMLAHLPGPIRLVMRTVGARQYRRYITRVRAV